MPTDSSSLNPIARFFKPVPFHEFFRILADTLDAAVLVISEDGSRIYAWNHVFILLSGYASTDLDTLTPSELFPDEAGEKALGKLLDSWEQHDVLLEDVPLHTHEGAIELVDIQPYPVSPSRSALLLILTRSSHRKRVTEHRRAQAGRLKYFTEISSLLLEGGPSAFPAALEIGKEALNASSINLYRVSATSPGYILNNAQGLEFPKSLAATDLSQLQANNTWTIGQRPDHLLHKAARAAGLVALHCSLLGTPTAWIGLLVAGWKEQEAVPPDTNSVMSVIANLCHAAILSGIQRGALAEAEQNVNRLEEEIANYFESFQDTLITLDENLHVLKANSAIHRSLGYQPEEIVGLPIQDVLVGPEDISATLLDALGHQRLAEQSRVQLHRRDGTRLPFHLRVVPSTSELSSSLFLILKDQSEQQAIEDQTETLSQRALLGELMAIFAHEVRNPINNISTGVQLVASRLGEDHSSYKSLQRVQKECNRLDQLMSDVLFFSRPLELKIEPIDLSELMNRILARWSPRLSQSDVSHHTTFSKDASKALADVRTLEQVIVNLITNALEAMPEGGTISIAVSMNQSVQGDMVELKIADTGPGIPPDVINRIYDPFFTTKKEGTGLGLAISRRIVTAHKGSLHVESFPDAGTVFTISLPAAKPSAGENA